MIIIRKKLLHAFVCTALVALSSPAMAQLDIPGSADVGRADSSIPSPEFGDVSSPTINIPEVRVDNAPTGADNIYLTLNDIEFSGVTAYSKAELEAVYAQYLGQRISLTQVYGIAQSITRKYRGDGYIITQAVIPQQEIDNGIVTIEVVEGYIDQVVVQSDSASAATNRIQALGGQLTQARPLRSEDLERWLLLINDLPGYSARSIISPSQSALGGADITIIPERDPYELSLSVDNYGSRFLGPRQYSAAAQFNDYLGLAEKIEAQFVTAGGDELLFGYSLFELPLNNVGTTLGFDITHSDTEPGFTLEQFQVEGRSTLLGIEATHPFLRSRTQNLFGSLRFDHRTLTSENVVDSVDRDDTISALRISADYNVFDNIWKPAVNEASITVSQGLDIFGASEAGDASLTRGNGEPEFTKAEIELSRLQTITPQVNFLAGLRGQVVSDPLLSSEEFGVGGRSSGRGYDPSEIVGDHGLAGTTELQWNNPVSQNVLDDYQVFGFYDIGKVWNKEEVTSATKKASLASTGFGVRADFNDTVSGELMAAFPLTRNVQTEGDTDARVFFSLTAGF